MWTSLLSVPTYKNYLNFGMKNKCSQLNTKAEKPGCKICAKVRLGF